MNVAISPKEQRKERLVQFGALAVLLLLAALALIGPYGLLSWGENSSKLEQYQARIAVLEGQMAELENRNELLDPDNVDADLSSELVRRNLNVAHPDEYVFELDQNP